MLTVNKANATIAVLIGITAMPVSGVESKWNEIHLILGSVVFYWYLRMRNLTERIFRLLLKKQRRCYYGKVARSPRIHVGDILTTGS